jgi:hypothetical protein
METSPLFADTVPVGIGSESFFITSVMKDCPVQAVIRELLQNAIEASGPGARIEWFPFEWEGIPKLGLYNEGAGMTPEELDTRMNIASSGRRLGYDANYGQGAKMSAGAASPYGLVYRSCRDGRVSEIWLQVLELPDHNKILVKRQRFDPLLERQVVVRDVTENAIKRGRNIAKDWTEAILLGREAEDNTLTGDFLGKNGSSWLLNLIAQRYYAFPAGITIHNASVVALRQSQRTYRHGRSMSELLAEPAYTARAEAVSVIHPHFGEIIIRYGKLAGTAAERGGGPWYANGLERGTHVCLVWKNEIYALDKNWAFRAGAYGFAGSSEDYNVHILLKDEAPVQNSNHRTSIITTDSSAAVIDTMDFATYVKDHRPAWLVAEIQERLEHHGSEEVQTRLQTLVNSLEDDNAKVLQAVLELDGGQESGVYEFDRGHGTRGVEGPPQPHTPCEEGERLEPGKGRKSTRSRMAALKVYFKDELAAPSWYSGMKGKAGAFDWGDNTLWLSKQFPTYIVLKDWIGEQWGYDPEQHAFASKTLDEEYRYRAGVFAIGGLLMRGLPGWSDAEKRQALDSVALSTTMRDPGRELQKDIRRKVGRKFSGMTQAKKGDVSHG